MCARPCSRWQPRIILALGAVMIEDIKMSVVVPGQSAPAGKAKSAGLLQKRTAALRPKRRYGFLTDGDKDEEMLQNAKKKSKRLAIAYRNIKNRD